MARGDRVAVFARGSYPELRQSGAEMLRGDLADARAIQNACAGRDVVFHAAAHPGIWGSWESFYQPNVIGTQNVLAACRAQHVPKCVLTSSPSVVFNNCPQSGGNESLPYPARYENFYAHTKALAEQMVLNANGADLLTVALRPHLIWGPRDPHLLPRLLDRARSGRLVQVGDGTNRVDLTYVADAARAHLLAADALTPGSPAVGAIYFISQDEPVNLWAWIQQFLERLHLPLVKHRISLPVARAIGLAMETAYRLLRLPGEPKMTRFLASELALDHYYAIDRAKKDLGYTPQDNMETALEKTLTFFTDLREKSQRR